MAGQVRPVIAVRPPEGSQASVKAGAELGLKVTAFPMSAIAPVAWQAPDPAGVDALLVGSVNVFRHGGPAIRAYHDKPVFAVGTTTAAEARQAGFTVGLVGEGGLQQLLARVPDRTIHLLRLAGRRHVDLALPPRVTLETRVVYEAVMVPMPDELAALLRQDEAVVLLHSAAAAEHFAAECERLAIDRGRISLAVLGERIAAAAGSGWRALKHPERPTESQLLALAAQLCH